MLEPARELWSGFVKACCSSDKCLADGRVNDTNDGDCLPTVEAADSPLRQGYVETTCQEWSESRLDGTPSAFGASCASDSEPLMPPPDSSPPSVGRTASDASLMAQTSVSRTSSKESAGSSQPGKPRKKAASKKRADGTAKRPDPIATKSKDENKSDVMHRSASREKPSSQELNWVTLPKTPKGSYVSPWAKIQDEERVESKAIPLQRIQVLLNNGWSDVSEIEQKQISANLAAGQTRFAVNARGTLYAVDFSNPDIPFQTNTATKTKRSLRILSDGPSDKDSKNNGSSVPTSKSLNRPNANKDSAAQLALGPQSKRGNAMQYQLSVLDMNPHAKHCFDIFAKNEERRCGDWAVFYHSYSFAALIYEVHAAIGAVLFRFQSQYASLPRLVMQEFSDTPDAATLMKRFDAKYANGEKDHHPEYRALAISVMCSLCALGPEASPPVVFIAGYSQADLSFRGVLEHLLESCCVPKKKIKTVASDILALSERFGLDVSQFGGKQCASGKPGHLLQIFIHRKYVDRLVYAAEPWGSVDKERQPIGKWLNEDSNTSWGQARILAHPEMFMQASCVRMHVISADPTFHSSREKFQEELTLMLGVVLSDEKLRTRAATSLWGGQLPPWWTPQDQRGRRTSKESAASSLSGVSATESSAPGGGDNSQVKQAYSDLIREVYREHNPSKLQDVDGLLDKYAGKEQELYVAICRKYGVKPKN